MQKPSVAHPTKFKISEMFFEVVTFEPVTNDQAAKIAMHFYKSNKFKKSDKGKSFQVITMFDKQSAQLL